MRPVKFKTTLIKPDAESGWHYLEIPAKIGEKFEKENGSRRVVCTINGKLSFQCALQPWKDIFTIIVNKQKRDKLKIAAGDTVDVVLEKDESKYGLPMPEEFREVLNQDPEGDKLFTHSRQASSGRSYISSAKLTTSTNAFIQHSSSSNTSKRTTESSSENSCTKSSNARLSDRCPHSLPFHVFSLGRPQKKFRCRDTFVRRLSPYWTENLLRNARSWNAANNKLERTTLGC